MAIDKHATIRGMVKDKPRRTDDLLQKNKINVYHIYTTHWSFKEQEWQYKVQKRVMLRNTSMLKSLLQSSNTSTVLQNI